MSAAYDQMAQTACRDEWGNCARGCVDSFDAGLAQGLAEGRQQGEDAIAALAWPAAQQVARNVVNDRSRDWAVT